MPQLTFRGAMSKGLDGPATALTKKIQCVKSYVGGILIGTVGDQFQAHTIGLIVHQNEQRQIISGATKTYFESNLAARINDPIADGDQVGQGNAKTFVE
jgi:hypothetical protein